MLFPSPTITLEGALCDLGAKDARVRAAAADALGHLPDDLAAERPRVCRALLAALGDQNFAVRAACCLSLGTLGESSAFDSVAERLHDGHAEVRQIAAISLVRLGDARGVEPLLRGLKEGPPEVRFQAAVSLAELDPARALAPLLAALDDADGEVREAVALALGLCDHPDATAGLAKLAEDTRALTRFEAACALAERKDARAIAPLCALLTDAAHAYRAIESLEILGDRRSADALAQVTSRWLVPRLVKLRAAAALLAVCPTHERAGWALDFMRKTARSGRAELRALARESLEKLAA